MSKPTQSDHIKQLQQRIVQLEEENNSLSEQVEETLLFGLISESFENITKEETLIASILEKIAILKGIPFCACFELRKRSIKNLGSYCSMDSCDNCTTPFSLSRAFIKKLHNTSILRKNYEQLKGNFTLHLPCIKLQAHEVILMPFNNDSIKKGFFVFISDKQDPCIFDNDLLHMQQILNIIGDKWERLNLNNKISKLNRELEKRIKTRTNELTRINELLFKEIQLNEVTNIELLDEKEKFRQLFEMANDAIYLWELDEQNKVSACLEANEAAMKMTGYNTNELSRMSPYALMAPNFKQKEKNLLQTLAKDKTHTFEVMHQHKNGSIFPVEINAHYFTLNKKKVILSITRDITDRKLTEQALIKAKEKAEESDKLKSSFLANMSHEIRTPMNAIMGFGEILLDDELTHEDINKFARIILNNGMHLLNLINDIVDFSKIEAGHINVTLHKINLNQLIEEVKLNTESLLRSYEKLDLVNVSINKPSEGINPIIRADYGKIRQVLSNLLNNAVKFTEKGSITITYNLLNDEMIELKVSDSGIGIPKDYQASIFDRFVQVKDERTFNLPGTGLGLAICRNLVELMGGNIKLESEKQKGTTFTFTLPYHPVESTNNSAVLNK
ncbi:PAS domain-containing sensor histidine kinase [Carboxylicivirga sp. N1Y90]|uniref:PAS domain-containing sensor histidine kinase n=1 Tax=Carboxylicivirga fragile TaxID=3417571 RepID=UPI003D3272AE|nr:PAS domain S-box protein [Marinilabiliaceae bacterium N1Y90]